MRTEVRRMLRTDIGPELGLKMAKKKDLLYQSPVDWILSAYILDWSDVDRFHLHVFAQALFVPAEYVVLSVGEELAKPGSRLKGSWDTAYEQDLIGAMKNGRSFLESVGDLSGYLAFITKRLDPQSLNPLYQEELVIGQILLGHPQSETIRALDRLIKLVDSGDRRQAFMEVEERARMVLELLDRGDSPLPLFEEWRLTSLTNLGIKEADCSAR